MTDFDDNYLYEFTDEFDPARMFIERDIEHLPIFMRQPLETMMSGLLTVLYAGYGYEGFIEEYEDYAAVEVPDSYRPELQRVSDPSTGFHHCGTWIVECNEGTDTQPANITFFPCCGVAESIFYEYAPTSYLPHFCEACPDEAPIHVSSFVFYPHWFVRGFVDPSDTQVALTELADAFHTDGFVRVAKDCSHAPVDFVNGEWVEILPRDFDKFGVLVSVSELSPNMDEFRLSSGVLNGSTVNHAVKNGFFLFG